MEHRDTDRQRALAYAFLLLKFRLRSESELRLRLKNKSFTHGVIQATVDFLKLKKFLDDDYFAKAWISSRLKKPLGLRRIRQELRQKGIEKSIIEDQIGKVKEDYCEEDVIRRIIKERSSKNRGLAPQKAKRRLYAYLLRRGFTPGSVIEAIRQL
ncbi:MAG: regulatory protein RecX [Candidatus Omnitrophica bacterium]|nr:regulatory protein RecX [Candidatus Omnitrophota bacterium]